MVVLILAVAAASKSKRTVEIDPMGEMRDKAEEMTVAMGDLASSMKVDEEERHTAAAPCTPPRPHMLRRRR